MTHRFSTVLATALTMLLTTAALALGLAAPALAHSELVSSSPEDGAELEQVPTEIVLEFNEDIEPIGTEVVVLDAESTPVADGEAAIEGPTVTQPISSGAAGDYTVSWRVVSADGHPISGELTFTVTPPETTEPATTEAETTEAETTDATDAPETTATSAAPDETSTADDDGAGSSTALWIALGIAAAAAAGTAAVLVARRRQAR